MFKPNAKLRKILKEASSAYVFRNGVIIRHRKKVKAAQTGTAVYWTSHDVYYKVDCDIPFDTSGCSVLGYSDHGLIVFNPKVLLDGLARVEFYFDNASGRMEELGITADTLVLHTPRGAEHEVNVFSFLVPSIEPLSANSFSSAVEMAADLARGGKTVVEWPTA